MEVAVAEEKKKIFRARKTMKISDRQQLETLHSTLLSSGATLSNPSPPPVLNGRHKEDGHKTLDKERHDASDSNSQAMSPASPASRGSPTPSLSLNLSPSPPTCQSPKNKEENFTFPTSPFRSLNFEPRKSDDGVMQGSPSNDSPDAAPTETKAVKDTQAVQIDARTENKKEEHTTAEPPATDSLKESGKNSVLNSSPPTPVKKVEKDCRSESDSTQDMEVVGDTMKAKNSTAKTKTEKPSSPKPSSLSTSMILMRDQEIKNLEPKEDVRGHDEDIKDEDIKDEEEEVKKGATKVEKMEVDLVKVEAKKEKNDVLVKTTKSFRPSSTPPSETDVQEKSAPSGLKRALSDGGENEKEKVERDGKRSKVDGMELEAQLELKITAKAGSRLKLEKVVQQLVEDRLRVLQLTVFDQNLQELKDRVEKIDCATKHQTTLNTLQAKITRLTKKFGEANQALENKRKQEASSCCGYCRRCCCYCCCCYCCCCCQGSRILKFSFNPTASPDVHGVTPAQCLTTPALVPASSITTSVTGTSVVSAHTPILQLITSSANAISSLAPGSITTQSPTGTLLVKTTSGSGMVAQGQQLLIQLPLSVTNGQTGTLVNLPVSSFSAVNSLSKSKTTTPTTTFILKPATATTVSALQNNTCQMSSAQISLARAVYQGGAGGIGTPNAGVSVTTARAPVQLVSVAGAVSSTLTPATSGPAATGSAAPGPPQGTSLTSKTDNQTPSVTPTKAAVSTPRPKGSVIDLTEDDDDVQVTGVKKATVTPSSATTRPVITIPNNAASRSSPQSNPIVANSPQVTVHHPPADSPLKGRPATTPTSRPSATVLPPLPMAPLPSGRLPLEATQTSPPQQPQLKLVPSQTGIVLSWCVAETDRTCAPVDSYHLYAFHQDNASSNSASQQHWKKIGEVKALPLPMACTLTQFQSGSTYHFAVRAKDIYGRFGSFCEPQCTNVIHSNTS
ncbi:Activating transcription factor 7-interacting protein 1 [Merluccius polli]|uniref:Activating transcription factor 7-interacting protein 1 n=1 Tax=Merluccius polli TaxID=89951 RepID=A0AA47MDH0_MERPO|nr:Activating transcription factor 7-interacting protein 1 [Merluccius polli]